MASDIAEAQPVQVEHIPQVEGSRSMKDLSPQALAKLRQWNAVVPKSLDKCLHKSVHDQCRIRPKAQAISSWDGDLSYRKLDELASQLAKYLATLQVGPETLIPLCFNKSKWMIVAMLAVMKAGGACVPVDPQHPVSRVREITTDVRAKVILVSSLNAKLVEGMAETVIVVSSSMLDNLNSATAFFEPSVQPTNVAFVVFTSGSTGRPKGILIEHVNLNTSMRDHSEKMNINAESRVLQFSSYAFDTSIYEIFTTLVNGGCVCVPSETEKMNDVARFIREKKVNLAIFTPSSLNILQPENVPDLETIVLGGEAITQTNVDVWASRVRLINGYGTAECTICAAVRIPDRNWRLGMFGHIVGGVGWVAEPENPQKLASLGTVGELLVEGPIIARGYLNDVEKTKRSFIDPPAWLQIFRGSCSGRLYRTGDLVQYDLDGALRYVGRRDTQVKLRGQRVELGEIENRVRQASCSVKDVAVEVVIPAGEGNKSTLTAFILANPEIHRDRDTTCREIFSENPLFAIPNRQFRLEALKLDLRLRDLLPSYMVPALYISLTHLPLTIVGKLDRRSLRQLASSMSRMELNGYGTARVEKRPPSTKTEAQLQRLWAERLGLDLEDIGADDNFFRLGGDSLDAMRLVEMARAEDFALTAADVINHPKLSDLALQVRAASDSAPETIEPFSLLADVKTQEQLVNAAMIQTALGQGSIEDIYPCTAVQQLLAALLFDDGGSFVARFKYELPTKVDLGRLRRAWEAAIESLTILQTRFILAESGDVLQVVVKDLIQWPEMTDLDTYITQDCKKPMVLGGPLTRLAIVRKQVDSGPYFLVFTAHHSLFDGWSLPLILSQVHDAYNGATLQKRPFNSFMRYLSNTDLNALERFWGSEFTNLNAAIFPTLPSPEYRPAPNRSLTHWIHLPTQAATAFTMSTFIRLAWAMVLAQLTNSNDVVFGITVNGRSVPVVDIEHIVGPTIAFYPLRIRVPRNQTIAQALQEEQEHAVAMIPFEQLSLTSIAKLAPEAATACGFQNEIVIQPSAESRYQELFVDDGLDFEDRRAFVGTALAVEFELGPDARKLTACTHFDDYVVGEQEVQKIIGCFEQTLEQILTDPTRLIGDMNMLESR